MRSAEAGGFGLVDGGGVEFAVGGVYDGFAVIDVERQVVDFFSGHSVYVALDHGVVAYLFVLVDFDAQSIGEGAGRIGKRGLRPEAGGASAVARQVENVEEAVLRTVLVHFYHVVHICAEQLIDVLLVNELILRPIFTLNNDGAAVFAADKVTA